MKSSFQEIKGVRFLFLRENDAYERGFAHGSLLKNEIKDQAGDILEYVQSKIGRASGKIFMRIVFKKAKKLRKQFSSEELREMEGISQGSGLPLSWIVLFNSIYEIAISFRNNFVACSFFAAPWKGTEKVVIGKTIDLYFEKKVTEFITKRRFIAVYQSKTLNNKFIAPSLPGLLVTDSVVTEKGTVFAVNDGGGAHKNIDFDRKPIVSIAWSLAQLESQSRVWLEALKKTGSIRPFACLVSDGQRNNTFLIEMCQGDYFVKRMDENIINTNHFVSQKMKEKWYVSNYKQRKEYKVTIKRGESIKNKIEKGISSLEEAVETIKIHERTFDPALGSVSNNGTVQGFIYLPCERKILFPSGDKVPPTFYGAWKEFDLNEILTQT